MKEKSRGELIVWYILVVFAFLCLCIWVFSVCSEIVMSVMETGRMVDCCHTSVEDVLAQLNGPWDGSAAGRGLWLMTSLELSHSPTVSVCWWQRTRNGPTVSPGAVLPFVKTHELECSSLSVTVEEVMKRAVQLWPGPAFVWQNLLSCRHDGLVLPQKIKEKPHLNNVSWFLYCVTPILIKLPESTYWLSIYSWLHF